MNCQFTQLRKGNVIVKCFKEACYHVAGSAVDSNNYCELHVSKLPRKTKLELLIDVIELPPDMQLSPMPTCEHGEAFGTPTENDMSSSCNSAGSVTSINMSSSDSEHDNSSHDEVRVHTTKEIFSGKRAFARPFKNLGELCECYGYLPRPKTWRMISLAVPGEINGLHSMRGLAIATNGIHVAIENGACTELYIGHLEWFVVDDLSAPAGARDVLKDAVRDTFKVVRNQLKEFDDLW